MEGEVLWVLVVCVLQLDGLHIFHLQLGPVQFFFLLFLLFYLFFDLSFLFFFFFFFVYSPCTLSLLWSVVMWHSSKTSVSWFIVNRRVEVWGSYPKLGMESCWNHGSASFRFFAGKSTNGIAASFRNFRADMFIQARRSRRFPLSGVFPHSCINNLYFSGSLMAFHV